MADVVFVGAGPVGIWTAIQIQQRCPEADIVMYERHEKYQRNHVLRLDTLAGCEAILDGRYDAVDENALYMIGTIDEVESGTD